MTYSIKLHYLSNIEYEGIDEVSDSYNETLELLGKEKEVFYYKVEDDITDFVETTRYGEIFEFEGIRDIHDFLQYKIIKINFLDISEDEINDFQEKFLSFLKDKSKYIYKFEDNRFLEIRKQFFEDIYKIEINLREVISFIFFTTYYDFGDFLKDLKINDITGKLGLKQEDLRGNLENEFFYISFKDYKNLLELRDLKETEKTELLKNSYNFEDWKRRIFERGIKDEPYIDFIESIKQDLEILENFRNAIMHSHNFTDKLLQNYEKSKDEIFKKIEDFRITHINIFGNELGLFVGNYYECTWDMQNFEKGRKYKLVKIDDFGDYTFIGDDGEELSFRDKEFYEYWK